MRKLIYLLFYLLFVSITLRPQYIDSLRQALAKNAHDTIHVFTLLRLSNAYADSDRDSALEFAGRALNLAEANEFDKGEAQSLNIIGSILNTTGNYPRSFEYHLEALKIAEKIKNQTLIAAIYNNLARVSTERSDHETALEFYFKAWRTFELLDRSDYVAIALLNIGDTYDRKGKADSAMYYLGLAREQAIKAGSDYLLGAIYSNMGHACVTAGNMNDATGFFRQSLNLLLDTEEQTDMETLAGVYDGLSKIFISEGKRDSAIFYAKRSMQISMEVSDQKRVLTAANQLNELFKETNIDSAYHYMSVANEIRDKILGEQKIARLEELKIDEKLRQQELAKSEAKRKKERMNNLRLISIVLFIITFFFILVILSRRKAHPMALKYLGLLGLLFVFEFIALFIHPYIDKWTDHHPVYMLIILVALGALLVPMHHKLEHWIKEKLVNPVIEHKEKKGMKHDDGNAETNAEAEESNKQITD